MYSRLSSKGQVTVPREIRRHLGLRGGSLLRFVLRDDRAEMVVVDEVMALKGSVPVPGPQDYTQIRARVEEEVARDAASESAVR